MPRVPLMDLPRHELQLPPGSELREAVDALAQSYAEACILRVRKPVSRGRGGERNTWATYEYPAFQGKAMPESIIRGPVGHEACPMRREGAFAPYFHWQFDTDAQQFVYACSRCGHVERAWPESAPGTR